MGAQMTKALKIDFVSDVVCPWCVIGLKSLETAIANASDVLTAEITFQPFELNPDMAPEGENVAEHIARKYGADATRSEGTRDLIRNSAAELGFTMATTRDSRIWNTFDCHRLLHWAALEGRQPQLKMALFTAHFTDQKSLADPEVLVDAAVAAGLDGDAARQVLESGAYIAEVRQEERHWREMDIHAVPAIIINDKYLITGGQPVAAFEKVLRRIAAEA
jgi:predicted DsbA family dithiol-disulfide isomerase